VRDVLRVKFIEGLFDAPYVESRAAAKESARRNQRRSPARRTGVAGASEKSNNTLPLSKNIKRLLVCGPTAKNKRDFPDRYGSNGVKSLRVEASRRC